MNSLTAVKEKFNLMDINMNPVYLVRALQQGTSI